jgi:hypothetical protein
MPLNLAQKNAWSLARSLMTIVVVFRIDGKKFGVSEAREFDGDPSLTRHVRNHAVLSRPVRLRGAPAGRPQPARDGAGRARAG